MYQTIPEVHESLSGWWISIPGESKPTGSPTATYHILHKKGNKVKEVPDGPWWWFHSDVWKEFSPTLRLPTPPISDTPGASKQVVLTPHDIPRSLRVPRIGEFFGSVFKNTFFKWVVETANYCWWLKSCTTWDVWNPMNNGKNYQPQLVQDFFHQQYGWNILQNLQDPEQQRIDWTTEEHVFFCNCRL